MQSSIYYSFIRGRQGEIKAIKGLSALACARAALVVDLPSVEGKTPKELEEHVSVFATDICSAWGVRAPLYVDLKRYGPEQKSTEGRSIVEHLFDCARQCKLRAIPVAGPLSERGPGGDYVDAVARIAAVDQRGVAFRVSHQDFSDPATLKREIDWGLATLSLPADMVDLFLDAEGLDVLAPDKASGSALLHTLGQAVEVARRYAFRTIVFVGSSVPDKLGPTADGQPRVVTREEFRVWKSFTKAATGPLVHFGDTGIWNPRQLDAGGGIPPARVRLPIGDEQVFFRADRSAYRKLCKQALGYHGVADLPRSRGLDQIRACAHGHGPCSGPTDWVARDTNIHIECAVRTVEEYLRLGGRLGEVRLTPVQRSPWQQETLLGELERPSDEIP